MELRHKMQINFKSLKSEKGFEASLQILILIIGTIAFGFIVGDGIERVSALDIGNILGTEQNPTNVGCCYDVDEGLCDPNSVDTECEARENGEFFEDPLCQDVSYCNKGCCLIGTQSQYVTRRRCEKLSELYGLPGNWDPGVGDELSCYQSTESQELGACVIPIQFEEENTCQYTSWENCNSIGGTFHKDKYCSDRELNTVCEPHATTSCVEGREDVYYIDSCGNIEEVYKDCDYNAGTICGGYRAGVDSRPGKGNYVCRSLDCKNAPLHGDKKGTKKNGESWCVYDGQIGEIGIGPVGVLSVDPVGSRHWRYSCVNGEVVSEGCADYRKEICVQETKNSKTNAFCRMNFWEQCIGYNGQQGCEAACMAKCVANPDCRIHPVHVSSNFKFNACVPKYAPGFDLGKTSGLVGTATNTGMSLLMNQLGDFGGMVGGISSQASSLLGGGTDSSQICGLASQTCTVTYQKMCPGGWKCVENCKCRTASFTTQLNNLCVSAGDCGVYINYVGRPTIGGAFITKKGSMGRVPPQPWILAPLYIVFAKAIPIQHVRIVQGVYDNVQGILNLPISMADPFLGGYARTGTGGGSQLENMFGSGQLAGTIGGIVIGAGAGIGIGVGIAAALPSSVAIGLAGGGFALFAGVGIALAIGAMFVMGCGQVKTVEITFNCQPWQRPTIGNCEVCNKDKYKTCSRYRCESLGMNCGIINEGTGFDKCVNIDRENTIPMISPFEEILNKSLYKYEDASDNGFKVRTKDGECIQAFTPLLFGVKTDVYANCRLSLSNNFNVGSETEGGDNIAYFFEGNLFTKNHTTATYLPSAESLIASEVGGSEEFRELMNSEINLDEIDEDALEGIDIDELEDYEGRTYYEYLLDQVGELNFYVKCANIDGRENEQDFVINFCVDPGPDLTPPVIVATAPSSNNMTMFNATEQFMAAFVNEPADCKWDITNPTAANLLESYNSLANTMACNTDVDSGTLFGYVCNTTLPITAQENKYYFMCRDQPWLGDNSSRNIGNVYEYNLKKSEFALTIDSIKPEGNITRGSEPITVVLEVKTSGGANNGEAWCEYKFEQEGFTDWFSETGEGINSHRHILSSMVQGEYEVNVNCIDRVGNTAHDKTSFTLELDKQIPEVARVYNEGGSLMVVTNEPADCAYVNDQKTGCSFSFLNETITFMDGADSEYHTTAWNTNATYYIRCKDIWENQQSGCSIIVKPYETVYIS